MPYLGNQPSSGGYHKLDSLTASATATYALTLGGSAYYPATANQLMVSLNGVIQAPQDSFTISGSNIVFASALSASDSIDFIMSFGDVYGIGTPADGTITDAKIQSMAASKLTGALPAIDGSALTGISSAAGSEYFSVQLDTDSGTITNGTDTVVDFGGSGTVVHDTASNFDTANDAYEFDSSDGLYIIDYSVAIRSASITVEHLIDTGAFLAFSTDNFTTETAPFGTGTYHRDNGNFEDGGITLTQNQLYKVTSSGTKVRLYARAALTTGNNYVIESKLNGINAASWTTFTDTIVTFMNVVRIA